MKGGRPYRIVMAEPFDAAAVARLQEIGQVDILQDSTPERLIEALPKADALLVRSRAHVTARIIEAAPQLKVIGRASPNTDHIDLRAARRRDISVVYAPLVAVTSTAEFTLGLMLTLSRRIHYFDRQVRDGKYDVLRAPGGHEMRNLTIGLLGIDPIAEKLGQMCTAAFGSPLIYHDPAGKAPNELEAKQVNLDTLLGESDIVSVHLPLSPNTRGLLNAERIAKLKPTAILVNTSRGPVIDTVALAQALKGRHIAGAALDVFESEPLPANHPLRRAPDCILTPHVAGSTLDASTSRFSVADDVVRVLQGEPPRHPVP
ncbi:MAG: 3-phosphoglycerate dehydrogenase [Phycisphaerae bacterium]|nr:3-phosphoglycerate dehydrogenase [Phycisphaerae bacterium]